MPSTASPPDPPVPDAAVADYLVLLESQLQQHWPEPFLGYHIPRLLRKLRDFVRFHGWPVGFEDRLALSLIPWLDSDARDAGVDWTRQGAMHGPLAELFDIDARTMNQGRGLAELSANQFTQYVAECQSLIEEHSRIRARMHNGEP